jgi:small subunit ribosomal protein S8
MMTDPIADLLTRIRNAVHVERPFVDVPASQIKVALVEALKREGFVWDHEIVEVDGHRVLRVSLKYGPNGEHVIQHISRVSKPGCRVYLAAKNMARYSAGNRHLGSVNIPGCAQQSGGSSSGRRW